MAVGSGDPISSHIGNGVTRSFGYGFTLLNAADLRVTIDGEVTSAYTVFGIGAAEGGTIEFTTAPANGARVLLELDIDLERKTQYQTNGDLLSRTVNDDFDRLWQALNVASYPGRARALRVPVGETVNDLPTATERANTILGFSGTGQPIVLDLPEDLPETSINRPPDVVATQGQTDVTVPFTYTRGNNSLRVFLNGGLQEPGDDYIELTTTSIRFTAPLDVGDEVTFEGGARLNPSSAIDGLSAEAAAAPGGLSMIGFSRSMVPTPGSAAEALMRTVPVLVDAITAVNATNLRLADGDVVVARGRTTAGDGGGGTFRYVAASAQTVDGGTVFQPTAGTGRLFREGWTVLGFNGEIDVAMFGAKGDGTTPDDDAFNDALAATLALRVYDVGVPGTSAGYLLNAPLVFPMIANIRLVGQGAIRNSASNVFTRLLPSHLSGPAVRLTDVGQGLKGIQVSATGARLAASYTAGQYGVLMEYGTDTNGNAIEGANIDDIYIIFQPGHAFVTSGPMFMPRINGLTTRQNKGHSLVIDDGTITSRTNKGRPGGFVINQFRSFLDLGYKFVIGTLASGGNGAAYRIQFNDADMSGWSVARDPTLCPQAVVGVVYGENIAFNNFAFEGRVGGVVTFSSAAVYGRAIEFDKCRFIGVTSYITAIEDPSFGTDDIIINAPYGSSDCTLNPAVAISGAVGNITVIAPIQGGSGEKVPVTQFTAGYTKGVWLSNTNLNLYSKQLLAASAALSGATAAALAITRDSAEAGMTVTRTGTGATAWKASAVGSTFNHGTTSDNDVVWSRNSVNLFRLTNVSIRPETDGAYAFGNATFRMENIYSQKLTLVDGVTAPSTLGGHASIYVDSADGDLKVKFGDGVVKTLATDT